MAVNQTRNVIFIDAPTAGSVILNAGVQARIGVVQVLHSATAVGELILYAAQSAIAARTIFHGYSPLSGVVPTTAGMDFFPIFPDPAQGMLFTDNGLFAVLNGASCQAIVTLA